MNFKEENINKLFEEAIKKNELIKIIFSSSYVNEEYKKMIIKPIKIKDLIVYQIEYFKDNKAYHKNLTQEEIYLHIKEVWKNFKNINFFTIDKEYSIINKNNKIHVTKKEKEKESVMEVKNHNNKKDYIIEEGKPVEFLIDLGIMDKSGKILKNSYSKYKQINKYLEFISDVLKELRDKKLIDKNIKIVDFGSGKSYLTFVLYYYLKEIKKMDTQIIGLDLKKDVMMECQKLAEKYKFENLKFIWGDIKDFEILKEVDMIFSLHACDNATDYAFLKGLELNAKAILAVPCCQHEFNKKVDLTENTKLKSNFSILMSHGIIQEKLSTLLTDSFRAGVMELCGYKSKVIEFIDMVHTPKNILIKCILNKNMSKENFNKKKEECENFIDFMGIDPMLYDLSKKYFKY